MKTIALSRCKDTLNVGDLNSSPLLYFDYPGTEHHDIKQAVRGHDFKKDADLYIFGGGAITPKVAGVNHDLGGIRVAWGIGQSIKTGEKYAHHTPLAEFDRDDTFFSLIGSRDVNTVGTEWVPCASCMSPLFDKEYPIEHDVVVYTNSTKPVAHPLVLGNRGAFEDVIRFIASGRVVLTDSYHGAYWATLLGRTAVCSHPYSSKFYQYKHQPVTMETDRHTRSGPQVYPEALAECRAANIAFDAKVRNLING